LFPWGKSGMSEKYNCPNCGAPIGKDDICPYCGTQVRWIPMIRMEYVPMNLGVRTLRSTCAVKPWEMEFMRPEWIEDRLVDQIAKSIVESKAYELSVQRDPFSNDTIYIADTLIGTRKGN